LLGRAVEQIGVKEIERKEDFGRTGRRKKDSGKTTYKVI
jgi:hypothetical protein